MNENRRDNPSLACSDKIFNLFGCSLTCIDQLDVHFTRKLI